MRRFGWGVLAALLAPVGVIVLAFLGCRPPSDSDPVAALNLPTDFDADGQRFCGRVETLRDEFRSKPWPDRRITYRVEVNPSLNALIPPDKVREAFRQAWSQWAAGIDIDPVEVGDEASALVRVRFDRIDGAGKVLAWSELSDGTKTPKHQLYDSGEPWTFVNGVPPANRIDLGRVAAHEIGHVLGLVHDEEGSGTLMAPTYSRAVGSPQKRDVDRALGLGYPPARSPTAPPVPASPNRVQVPVASDELAEALRRQGWKVEPPK